MLKGLQLPDDSLLNTVPARSSSVISVCPPLFALFVKHSVMLFSFSELPYGWEEIDDPQYGTYYVE